MAFRQCFLRPPELTKKVLPKVLQNFQKTPKCTCWPKELNQKDFPRNIQYRTRPKGPFFRHCAIFFSKKLFSPRKAPLQFFRSFATEWMLKNPKGSSLSVYLEFCNRMDVEKFQRVLPFSFFRHCETFFQIFLSPNIKLFMITVTNIEYQTTQHKSRLPKKCWKKLVFHVFLPCSLEMWFIFFNESEGVTKSNGEAARRRNKGQAYQGEEVEWRVKGSRPMGCAC